MTALQLVTAGAWLLAKSAVQVPGHEVRRSGTISVEIDAAIDCQVIFRGVVRDTRYQLVVRSAEDS